MTERENLLLKCYMDKDKEYRLSEFIVSYLFPSYTPEYNSILNSIILLANETYD